MGEPVTDGMLSFIGGMDSSRDPMDIAQTQYSRGCNVIIPRSLGGLKVRHGIHHQYIHFESPWAEELYRTGYVQAEGWFTDRLGFYLIAVVDGYVFRFTKTGGSSFYGEVVNRHDPNTSGDHWVIRVPYGCIVNNGVELPIFVERDSSRRTNPDNEEIGIGRMGVYVQNRLFYSNANGNIIYASDFNNPISVKEHRLTGIYGFQPPENTDIVTAIAKQKVMLEYAEGGALVFSTRSNIYSVDVRGDRNTWGSPSTRVGKVTQTVEGLSAISSYSFEPFGTNLFFRTSEYGMADLRQSQYQFNQMDAAITQSAEVAIWMENDTPWMLTKCYSRSWNARMFTTVTPQRDSQGRIYWSGMVSYHPSVVYSNQETGPRRFEGLITGVRPWCMTSVKEPDSEDQLFIHSYDEDGINRLYAMSRDTTYDINERGQRVEIEGWVEFRALTFNARYSNKKDHLRFYSLREFNRDLHLEFFARNQNSNAWVPYYSVTHTIGYPYEVLEDGSHDPRVSRPQTRYQINMPGPDFSCCSGSKNNFIFIQHRLEFRGPLHFDSLINVAMTDTFETTVPPVETRKRMVYDVLPDYGYSIVNAKPLTVEE